MVKVGRAVIESAAIGDSGLPPDQWRDQKLQHCRRRMRVPKAALTARKTRSSILWPSGIAGVTE